MSDSTPFGFSQFVPGFDFLKNLAGSAVKSAAGVSPIPAHWVTPTLSVEELDKRIQELKAVQFWLDQNAAGLRATIQALEVQKMTLSALKSMNFNMGELAEAFKIKPVAAGAPEPKAAASKRDEPVAATEEAEEAEAAPAEAAAKPGPKKRNKAEPAEADAAPAREGVVDPLQWWGALTQQFQNIAASAMQDAATQTTRGLARDAFKTASDMASSAMQAAVPKARTAKTEAAPLADPPSKPARKPVRKTARKRAPRSA